MIVDIGGVAAVATPVAHVCWHRGRAVREPDALAVTILALQLLVRLPMVVASRARGVVRVAAGFVSRGRGVH